jgi:hypothetical protein
MKADNDRIITMAWQVENFGRMGKNLKNLDHYIKPPTSAEKKRALLAMFVRKKQGQEGGDHGNR